MEITTEEIKKLREESGAGIMDCRNALKETNGDKTKALEILQKQGLVKAQKSAGRAAKQGLVTSYIHSAGRIGALVEINCETDFVARTAEFQEMAHNIAMQVAAMEPEFVSKDECPTGAAIDFQNACLLLQPYIKDPTRTVQDLVTELIAKTGENIVISRFARFELGK
ncbi:MAG: translation elongation factor Ts [Dehalococcoidales bacterium]|nr:translation elongation factor Ts [Dehalococcoidales bacterium]